MQPVGQLLHGALAELVRDAPLSEGKVQLAWRAAVGPALERVTTVRLQDRVLVVETVSAPWAREISRSSAMILARVQAVLGEPAVQRIAVRRP